MLALIFGVYAGKSTAFYFTIILESAISDGSVMCNSLVKKQKKKCLVFDMILRIGDPSNNECRHQIAIWRLLCN
jgi:hypothetical protein